MSPPEEVMASSRSPATTVSETGTAWMSCATSWAVTVTVSTVVASCARAFWAAKAVSRAVAAAAAYSEVLVDIRFPEFSDAWPARHVFGRKS